MGCVLSSFFIPNTNKTIKFTPQALDDEQKAQARSNIGFEEAVEILLGSLDGGNASSVAGTIDGGGA